MPLLVSNKQRLLTRVEECYQLAEQQLACVLPRPIVLFNQRGKIAGSALLQRNTLRFHPQIYQQNLSHFLQHVVAHEIAHLIVWQKFGRVRPHGKEWQAMMISVFSLPPERTHQYDTDNIGIRTIQYQCKCTILSFSVKRHNNVLKGTTYLCRRCRGQLIAL
ncbi:MAG: SprT family zinc-dependent metalloprotease [Gammaproteobacteria bacterium]|nr:SprT family zinc-dependent metalloprotease [Gammaproteobacteria bacterium]